MRFLAAGEAEVQDGSDGLCIHRSDGLPEQVLCHVQLRQRQSPDVH